MARIEYRNDGTRATEEAEGSDGRLNVSSRSDGRAYYNSRDEGQCYTAVFEHIDHADGELSFSIQNTSTDKTLVIDSIGLNCLLACRAQLYFASIASQVGDAVTPVNLNKDSSHDAQATMLEAMLEAAYTVEACP